MIQFGVRLTFGKIMNPGEACDRKEFTLHLLFLAAVTDSVAQNCSFSIRMSTEHHDPNSKETSKEMNTVVHGANQCVCPRVPSLKQELHAVRPARMYHEDCPCPSSASSQANAELSGTSLKDQIFSAAAGAFLGFNSKHTWYYRAFYFFSIHSLYFSIHFYIN